ncbi:MAG TPA: phosphopantetheine-binding protein [Verrucomicrobiota bacterium]|jgi:acyl carrier protein|nr:phosphopantetheine-binding protein [Verrucomicrobiota bacterium]HRT08789.1 phosphopantetheine-binding protein [Candidatus Paceibacterota bacterium]HRT57525.1 phosphopantetheine-binding protein [Candidatus Paceibacterota bacterium]
MDDFLKSIAAILEVPEVKETDDLKSFEQWDSLSVLSVIAMLDAKHGVNLKAADLAQVNSAGELWRLVQSRKGV